jgi:hypothetical protein
MKPLIDLVGKRFGRLVVTARSLPNLNGHARWICRCDCGESSDVLGYHLRNGRTQSCGCLRDEAVIARCTKHQHAVGYQWTAEYRAWQNMKNRCKGTQTNSRKWYADRGITVCAEWTHSFEAFLAHLGPRPSPEHSIDRIDVNGNYEPGNVRWATPTEQARNKRSNGRCLAP